MTVDMRLPDGIEGAVWLRIDDGSALQAIRLAPGQELVLGSGPMVDVPLPDPTVSARHAAIAHRGDVVEVRDLGSRNGVRVGGARVTHARLSAGAVVEIGRTTARIDAPGRGSEPCEEATLPSLVGRSAPIRRLAASVRRLAPLRLPVMIRGESGTGKDLVARALHDESPRARGPFVVLNAATISRELAESELFGHQRGAFTGAMRDRRGAFRQAHGGTLFLDEIAALPIEVQAKLLRVVEEGVVRPLGSEAGAPVDVRLVAATCEPLEAMVSARRFRADLYERLAVCVVRVPSLRERVEDIPALSRHLLATSELGGRELSEGVFGVLRAHRWPGNVRELRNVILQAAVRASGPIGAEHVAAVLADRAGGRHGRICPEEALRIFEDAGGNVSRAARNAGLPRSTMRDLLRAAGVRAQEAEIGVEEKPDA
jgi:DNA-binding NtrC family response regulator